MLCANHRPILNDVTHAELQLLLYRVSKISPIIANGLSSGRLTCYSSGQASPCLDLSRLNKVCNYFLHDLEKLELITYTPGPLLVRENGRLRSPHY